jgi:hypothetical protein
MQNLENADSNWVIALMTPGGDSTRVSFGLTEVAVFDKAKETFDGLVGVNPKLVMNKFGGFFFIPL